MSQDGNGSSPYEQLYDKCLTFSPLQLCDFFFGKSTSNLSNSKLLSNYSALTYNDKDHGFSIRYPLGWTIRDKTLRPNIAIFDSPNGNATVNIRVFPQSVYESLTDFGDTFKKGEDNTLLAYYKNSTTLLAGKPAFKAIYLTTYNASLIENAFGNKSSTSKAMFIATLVPEKKSYFAVACFAHPADFDSHRPVFQKMADSLRIYGKEPIIQEDNSSSSLP
jgi:PsbP